MFFAEAFCTKINVNVEYRDGSAEHITVFTVDGSPLCIDVAVHKMQAVAHTAPVSTLKILNIKSPAEYQQAQHYDAEKTDVHSPKYVTFYFQCICVFF